MTARAAWSLVLLTILIAPACRKSHDKPAASVHAYATDDPKDTDSLYKLLRQALVDSNPKRILQAYACELARVSDRLPGDVFDRRINALSDTVYTPAERLREIEIASRLANGDFALDKQHCGPDFRELGTYKPPDSLPSPNRKGR